MKISLSAGVLLLSAAVLSLEFEEEENPVAKIKYQHINEEMDDDGCTEEMNNSGEETEAETFGRQLDPRVKKFINQHINQNMKCNSCDAVIKQRRISKTNSKRCKKENTFISASYGVVQKVCGNEGEKYPGNQNLRISLKKFRVVNCRCNKNKSLPHCKCRGSDANLRIVISCDEKGNPVHYEKGVKIPDESE